MFKNITILILFLANTLFAAPELKMFERFPSADGGPDTRGAIWYDEKHNNIFVADHGKGLWKIDECSNIHGDTSSSDGGLWDISHDKGYIFAIGKNGLSIYDENGVLLNTLSGIDGEGLYVKDGYAYVVNAGSAGPARSAESEGGIIVVNVKNIDNPHIVKTVMTGEQFSQIRGGKVKVGSGEYAVEKKLIYVSSLDGKLYLFETNGASVSYKDDITIFPSSEARKIFVGKKEQVYINSNFGELAIVKVDKSSLKLSLKGTWQSSESHGGGQQSPAAGGVFVTEVKEKLNSKVYALITAADGNQDGYLYWLDVTDPTNIKKVDALHDTEENYGFNDIWVNDTKIYLVAHDGFCFMGMNEARNMPVISIQDSNGTYKEDINVTQSAASIGDTKIFYAKISNKDAANKLDLKLKAPEGDSNWDYHYYLLSTNEEITNKITNHGYEKEKLDPGDDIKIKIEITPISKNATDTTVTIIASNKKSKDVCGKAIESDEVSAKVTFKNETNAFTCSSNSYIFTSTNKDKPTDSYTVDILTGSSSLEKSHFHTTNINAIGYNVKDNYIWGYDRINEKVARVDANYKVTSFDIKNLPAKSFISGDVSLDGVLYLYEKKDSKIYRVDVDPASSNYLKKLDDLEITKKIKTSDMAFNPIDNKIYLMGNNDRKLYSIDTANGNVRDLGSTKMPGSKSSGANYFDKDGNFYIYNNSGKIYKIDISDPDNIDPKAVFLSDAPEFESKDGARCPNAAIDTPPPANSECSLSFPGAVSSTNDEIQINVNTKIYGTTNHTLITKMLAISEPVRCDDAPCKKSNTLAKKMDFDLLLGNGSDGDKILSDNKTLTISSNKEYKKFQTGQHNTITINGDITIKSQSDFYINANSEININGNVVIYADKFDSNQQGIFKINGSLKIIANIFYLNSGNKIQNIPNPEDFVVLAKDIIDINSQVDFKGLFYSAGDIQINNDTKISGALTGNYIDINDKVVINYDASAVDSYCNPSSSEFFNSWDQDESISNQVIKTKIVGEDINLTFASLNKNGTSFENTDAKNIKVALFNSSEQLTIWNNIILESATHMDISFSPATFAFYGHQNQTFKDVQVVIKYENDNGTAYSVNAIDHFAIRPKSYNLSINPLSPDSILKAGSEFNITIEALDTSGNIIKNYEEIANVYKIALKETNTNCKNGIPSITNVHFVNGIAYIKGRYSEVGKVDFNVSEVLGREYALIDNSDGSNRFIEIDKEKDKKFAPKSIDVVWTFKDANIIDNMTYYSHDASEVGAPLYLKVSAKNGASVMENFSAECYAEDIHIKTHFNSEGVGGAMLNSSSKIIDGNQSGKMVDFTSSFVAGESGIFSYDISRANFIKGEATQTTNINFDRDQRRALEPMKFTIDELNATTDESSIIYKSGLVNHKANFFYARAHAPTQTSKDKIFNATIYYEVYCKKCIKEKHGLKDQEESIDSIYWYIVSDNNMFFDFNSAKEVYSQSTLNVSKVSSSEVRISTTKIPHQNIITYEPKDYLIYNMFNSTNKKHKFKIEQFGSGNAWAGKGDLGLTVDTKASPLGYRKMDW